MKNITAEKLLALSFNVGAFYFICMATAHFFGIKWPLLFVYYDTPFYAYQDKIISFAVMAYVGLFYLAAKVKEARLTAVAALGITFVGLAHVNLSNALGSVMSEDLSTTPYWLQTAFIGTYWAWLGLLLHRTKRK